MLDSVFSGAAAYLGVSLSSWLRYFLIAGGLTWFLGRWFARYRVQTEMPPRSELLYQIRWSLISLTVMGFYTMFFYWLVFDGHTRMYFDVGERGWLYLVFSFVLGIVGYDAWIYWHHRVLHLPFMFRWVHTVHHYSPNPTPFAVFTFHPIEVLASNTFYVLFVLLVPIHPIPFIAMMVCFTVSSLMGHCGYELFPAAFRHHPAFRWINSSTHHNMHHSHVDCNYGHLFNYWDRWMGTNHPGYGDWFDTVKARLASNDGRAPSLAGAGAMIAVAGEADLP